MFHFLHYLQRCEAIIRFDINDPSCQFLTNAILLDLEIAALTYISLWLIICRNVSLLTLLTKVWRHHQVWYKWPALPAAGCRLLIIAERALCPPWDGWSPSPPCAAGEKDYLKISPLPDLLTCPPLTPSNPSFYRKYFQRYQNLS